jgi:choline dehydrogenase-like flavoprotein
VSIYTGAHVERDLELSCDVCVVGSGAGGAVVAQRLATSGKSVIVLEDGGFHVSARFDMTEREHVLAPLPGAGRRRATADQSMAILQGRAVGGTTVVNWTTCFRTPERVMQHWAEHHGVEGLTHEALVPHWEASSAPQRGADAPRSGEPRTTSSPGAASMRSAGTRICSEPEREELRAHGLLRHGLRDRRQAEHARDVHPGGRARGRRGVRQRVGRAAHLRRAPRHRGDREESATP